MKLQLLEAKSWGPPTNSKINKPSRSGCPSLWFCKWTCKPTLRKNTQQQQDKQQWVFFHHKLTNYGKKQLEIIQDHLLPFDLIPMGCIWFFQLWCGFVFPRLEIHHIGRHNHLAFGLLFSHSLEVIICKSKCYTPCSYITQSLSTSQIHCLLSIFRSLEFGVPTIRLSVLVVSTPGEIQDLIRKYVPANPTNNKNIQECSTRNNRTYSFGLPPTQDASHKWRFIVYSQSLLKME